MASDIRNARTERAIVDALVKLLETKPFTELSISEVAHQANVSRSTFYAHFGNLREVFDRAVFELASKTRTLSRQFKCSECSNDEPGVPFCIQLRQDPLNQHLTRDPSFLAAYMNASEAYPHDKVRTELEDAGVPANIASTILRFQLSGCYAVATRTPASEDWSKVQKALDTFIQGGLSALRSKTW